MPIETKIRCDYCPTVKQETNHFWMLRVEDQSRSMKVMPLDIHEYRETDKIACGQGCATVAVAQHMDSVQKAETDSTGE
jgi:hypothetical protein